MYAEVGSEGCRWERGTEPPHGTGIRNTGNSRGSRGGGGLSEGGSPGNARGWVAVAAGSSPPGEGLGRVTSRGN